MDPDAGDPHDLARFVEAQAPVYAAVVAELGAGRKQSHWMWFVFPQLRGLGSSPTARRYAIASLAEARAYLAHPVLGDRLRDCTRRVLDVHDRTAREIFGEPDDMKFRSCLTLFDQASGEAVFQQARARFFEGRPDARTLALLA